MKKWISAVAAAALVLGLAACSDPSANAPSDAAPAPTHSDISKPQ